MNLRNQLFINGQWQDGDGSLEVINPSTGQVITKISTAGEKECDAALDAADKAFPAWAATAPRFRAEILRKAFELMSAEVDEIAKLISMENGKVFSDARGEAVYAAEFFRWFSEETVRTQGDFRKSPSGDKTIIVTHQPIGPSLLITPWNFPAAMATRKLAPALAAGCTAILKAASETPLTALYIVDLLDRAGVPKGVVNFVMPSKTGAMISKMLHDPRLRNISFTGSTEVGRILIKESADLVIRTSMELGGNAPFLVFDDSDVEQAVAAVMIAKMRNGGAACTSANRIYVQKAIATQFTDALAKAMGSLKMADGLSEGAQLGASVSIKERNKIAELVESAVNAGGKIEVGGAIPAGDGAFYPATVISVSKDNPILNHEIFGPVAPVVTFETEAEGISLANNTEYGLISYVFSGDMKKAIRVAEKLESGMVAINRGVISDPAAPFGGVKQSGLGREGGFAGIHEFLETKFIGVEL